MIAPIFYFAAIAGAVVLIGLVSLLWSKRPRPRRRDVELAQQRAVFGDATGRISQWRGVRMVERSTSRPRSTVGEREQQGRTRPGT